MGFNANMNGGRAFATFGIREHDMREMSKPMYSIYFNRCL